MKLDISNAAADRQRSARRDPIAHLKVEQALSIQRAEGTFSAARQLAANGMAFDLARRVLATLKKRETGTKRWRIF